MATKRRPRANARDAMVIDGVRTPFLKSNGAYASLMAHDLGREAVKGLLKKTALDPALVDQVTMGTVIADPRTSNVAREISLGAGLPLTTPAYTTTLACISANVAATTTADAIRLGRVDTAIVGGTETFSDPPIRLSKNLRQALSRLQKAKGPADYLKELSKLSPSDIAPDVPSPNEFSTGLSMGASCERMARRFSVSRAEGDEFAAMSHQRAAKAWDDGIFADDVMPFPVPPRFKVVDKDNGPRGDSTAESLAKLRPAFDKKYGSITAGSSSFLTDGATAVLLMSRAKAKEAGFTPLAIMRDYVYAAGDPLDELLLGPALTIPMLLAQNGLKREDIDVWEIHEAFAAQMVANLKALDSETFCKERLGLSAKFGELPLDKVNVWGGSLSLGHPFGATGGRLLKTAARRLQVTGARYAVIAACAAGGQGSAILLENPAA